MAVWFIDETVPWATAVFLVAVVAVSVLYLEPELPVEADLYRDVWGRDIELPSSNVHGPRRRAGSTGSSGSPSPVEFRCFWTRVRCLT